MFDRLGVRSTSYDTRLADTTLGWAARLEIPGCAGASQKIVQPGMRFPDLVAGSRQRMCRIVNPLATVGQRQSAGNIVHNCL